MKPYTVTVTFTMPVLAANERDAEEIAQQHADMDEPAIWNAMYNAEPMDPRDFDGGCFLWGSAGDVTVAEALAAVKP